MDGPAPAMEVKRRACVNCTAAKTRCNPRTSGVCERCAQGGKPCVYQELPKRKQRAAAQARSAHGGESRRFEELESKVDSLIAQLAAIEGQGVASVAALSSSSPSSLLSAARTPLRAGIEPSPPGPKAGRIHAFPSEGRATAVGTSSRAVEDDLYYSGDVVDRGLVSQLDAEASLQEFRANYVPRCPFVAIDPFATVDGLRRQYPLLFLAIVAVTESARPSLQALLGEELCRQVSSRMLIKAEKSLDILRALLVYTAWFQYFFEPKRPQSFLMLHLCLTLVNDLGLERRVASTIQKRGTGTDTGADFQHNQPESHGTSEEKRALLGTYWLAACVAKAYRKPPSLVYTSYMSKCCEELADQGEYATDTWIKPLIHLQALTCRVGEAFNYHGPGTTITGETPIQMATSSFLRELTTIESMFPLSSGEQVKDFPLEFSFLLSWIHEVAFHNDAWTSDVDLDLTSPSLQGLLNGSAASKPLLRTGMLWRIVDENGRFLRTFIALPTQDLFRLCFATFSKLCYTLISQARVAFALLDLIGSVDQTEDEIKLVQSVLHKIGYNRHCSLLISKFTEASSPDSPAGEQRDAMANFGTLSKAMMGGYSKQLQDWLHRRGINPNEVELSQDMEESCRADGIAHRAVTTQTQGDSGAIDIGNWQNLDFGSVGDMEYFDDMTWERIMNEFTLPHG